MEDKRKNIFLFSVIGLLLIVIVLLVIIIIYKDGKTDNELMINDKVNNGSENVSNESSNKVEEEEEVSNGSDGKEVNNDNSSSGDSTSNDANDKVHSEDDIVSYFEEMEEEVTSSKWDNVKGKAKEYFITVVDFIFYDKEIKGYTFKELGDTSKLKIISVALKIDGKIEEKIPGYKESISSTTGKIYTDIKEKLVISFLDISSTICKDNEDGCAKAKDIFSDIKDVCKISWDFIKNLAKSGVSKLKDWYEIYSGK